MKIGPKIALFYSLITMCAIIMVMSVFYLFSSRYINRLYESYLREKAFITAQKYWEKDEVDEQSYRLIQQKYDELLPQAREVLLNMDTLAHVKDTLGKYLNASQQERLFHGDGTPVTFKYKKELGAALYYPDNEGYFIVFVFSENTYGKEIQEHILLLSVTLVVISSIFIFFIGRVYSNWILTPLQHILKELKRIRANNLNVRLRGYGNKDELDQLIVSLNGMLDRIDTAFKSEKSFVSNASHELNNPLTAIQGECEIALLKERSTSEYMDSLERISVESKRISLLIKSLLFLSRQDKDILANTVEDVCLPRMLREQYAGRPRIRLSSTLREENDFIVRANPYLLGIALQNVVDNACKYSDKDVEISLFEKEGWKVVEIRDQGIGIPQEEVELIFQSFYRASNTRSYKGQGIGLSLSLKIISTYGGQMGIHSEEGHFTTVSITFPLSLAEE